MKLTLNCDASPAMIEIALERLIERGEVVIHGDMSCDEMLRIMPKVYEEINQLNNKEDETEI